MDKHRSILIDNQAAADTLNSQDLFYKVKKFGSTENSLEEFLPEDGVETVSLLVACRRLGNYRFLYLMKPNFDSDLRSAYDLVPIKKEENIQVLRETPIPASSAQLRSVLRITHKRASKSTSFAVPMAYLQRSEDLKTDWPQIGRLCSRSDHENSLASLCLRPPPSFFSLLLKLSIYVLMSSLDFRLISADGVLPQLCVNAQSEVDARPNTYNPTEEELYLTVADSVRYSDLPLLVLSSNPINTVTEEDTHALRNVPWDPHNPENLEAAVVHLTDLVSEALREVKPLKASSPASAAPTEPDGIRGTFAFPYLENASHLNLKDLLEHRLECESILPKLLEPWSTSASHQLCTLSEKVSWVLDVHETIGQLDQLIFSIESGNSSSDAFVETSLAAAEWLDQLTRSESLLPLKNSEDSTTAPPVLAVSCKPLFSVLITKLLERLLRISTTFSSEAETCRESAETELRQIMKKLSVEIKTPEELAQLISDIQEAKETQKRLFNMVTDVRKRFEAIRQVEAHLAQWHELSPAWPKEGVEKYVLTQWRRFTETLQYASDQVEKKRLTTLEGSIHQLLDNGVTIQEYVKTQLEAGKAKLTTTLDTAELMKRLNDGKEMVTVRRESWRLLMLVRELEDNIKDKILSETNISELQDECSRWQAVCTEFLVGDVVLSKAKIEIRRIMRVLSVIEALLDKKLMEYRGYKSYLFTHLKIPWDQSPELLHVGDLFKCGTLLQAKIESMISHRQRMARVNNAFDEIKNISEEWTSHSSVCLVQLQGEEGSVWSEGELGPEARSFREECMQSARPSPHPWVLINSPELVSQASKFSLRLKAILQSGWTNLNEENSRLFRDEAPKYEEDPEIKQFSGGYWLRHLLQFKQMLNGFLDLQHKILYIQHLLSSNRAYSPHNLERMLEILTKYVEWENNVLLGCSSIVSGRENAGQTMKCLNSLVLIGSVKFVLHLGKNWHSFSDLRSEVDRCVQLATDPLDKARDLCPTFALLTDDDIIQVIGNWDFPCLKGAKLIRRTTTQSSRSRASQDSSSPREAQDSAESGNRTRAELISVFQKFAEDHLDSIIQRLFRGLHNTQIVWRDRPFYWEVTGVHGAHGEVIKFERSLPWTYSPARWFSEFQDAVMQALSAMTIRISSEYCTHGKATISLQADGCPFMCLDLAQRIHGWIEMENCLQIWDSHAIHKKLEEVRSKYLQNLQNMQSYFTKFSDEEKKVERILQHGRRQLCSTLMELIQAIQNLLEDSSIHYQSFSWLSMLKHQLIRLNDCDNPLLAVTSMHTVHRYGWEYWTAHEWPQVAPCPGSREMLALAAALADHSHALLVGPAGCGKRTLVSQLSTVLGRRLREFDAWSLSDTDSLKRRRTDLREELVRSVRCGSLMAVYELQDMPLRMLTALLSDANKIKASLLEEDVQRSGLPVQFDIHADPSTTTSARSVFSARPERKVFPVYSILGHQIAVRPGYGLFFTMCMNRFHTLPEAMRGEFRSAYVALPDWNYIKEALVTTYLPGYVGTRVRQLLHRFLATGSWGLGRQMISVPQGALTSWSLICTAMRLACQEWSQKFTVLQNKRLQMGLRSVVVLRAEEDRLAEQIVARALTLVWSYPDDDELDQLTCTRLSEDSLVRQQPSLEQRLFAIEASFPANPEKVSFSISQPTRYPPHLGAFVDRLLNEIKLRNLQIIPGQIAKVVELWQLVALKSPILILGSVGSGKSTVCHLLQNTLNAYAIDRCEPGSPYCPPKVNCRCPTARSKSAAGTEHGIQSDIKECLHKLIGNFEADEAGGVSPVELSTWFPSSCITTEHFFPGAQEDAISLKHHKFYLDSEPKLRADTSLSKEWLILDTGDQCTADLDCFEDRKIQALINNIQREGDMILMWEKTHLKDISPGLLHHFSLCLVDDAVGSSSVRATWIHNWRTWFETATDKFMLNREWWDSIQSEFEDILLRGLKCVWDIKLRWAFGSSDLPPTEVNAYEQSWAQQAVNGTIALMNSLLSRYFPREVWELRSIGQKPAYNHRECVARINRYWADWRRVEERKEFQNLLIRTFFAFSFIWGFGGSFAGDPRLRVRFEMIAHSLLEGFAPSALPGCSTTPSSPECETISSNISFPSLVSCYPSEFTGSFQLVDSRTPSWRSSSELYQTEMEGVKVSLFNCMIDLQTAQLSPFWLVDCVEQKWPEEYLSIIPASDQIQPGIVLPTLHHLTPHLMVGQLLAEANRPVILSGPQGSGRSQLAMAIVAHRQGGIQKFNWKKVIRSRVSVTYFGADQKHKRNSQMAFGKGFGTWIIEDINLISDDCRAQMNFQESIRKRFSQDYRCIHSAVYARKSHCYEPVSSKFNLRGSNFYPLLTAFDDHCSINPSRTLRQDMGSLFYRFSTIGLTDPTLSVMDSESFNQQRVYGFGPLSLLAQIIMGHGIARSAGYMVQRLCWTIWNVHCLLMRERLANHPELGINWIFAVQWAGAVGQHIRKLLPCQTAPIHIRSSVSSNYCRWTNLILSDPIQKDGVIPSSTTIQILDGLCYEASRLIPVWLPEGICGEKWVSCNLYRSMRRYILRNTPEGMLVPISYLLLGPRGSLFLNDEVQYDRSRRKGKKYSIRANLSTSTGKTSSLKSSERYSSGTLQSQSACLNSAKTVCSKETDTETSMSADIQQFVPFCLNNCHSWAPQGKLNPNLAPQPSQGPLLPSDSLKLFEQRIRSTGALSDSISSLRVVGGSSNESLGHQRLTGLSDSVSSSLSGLDHTKLGCSSGKTLESRSAPQRSAYSNSGSDAALGNAQSVHYLISLEFIGYFVPPFSAFSQDVGNVLVVNQDEDTTGILGYEERKLIQQAGEACDLREPHYVEVTRSSLERLCEIWSDRCSSDLIIMDCSHVFNDDVWEQNRQPPLMLLNITHLLLMQVPWNRKTSAKPGEPRSVWNKRTRFVLILPNKSEMIHYFVRSFRWQCLIRFTTQSFTAEGDPNSLAVSIDPLRTCELIANECLRINHDEKGDKMVTIKEFFTRAHLLMSSRIKNSFDEGNRQRLLKLRATLVTWCRLQDKHSELLDQCGFGLIDDAIKGCKGFKNQLSGGVDKLEVQRREFQMLTECWIPRAEDNLQQVQMNLDRSEKAAQKARIRLESLKGPLEKATIFAKQEVEKISLEYQKALNNLFSLPVETLDEIRSYQAPPEPVRSCVYAVCMLMDEEENWKNAKQMMVPLEFVSKILRLHERALSPYHHEELKTRLTLPDLSPEKLKSVSLAAYELSVWLRALCKCGDAIDRIQQKVYQMTGNEHEMAEAEADLARQSIAAETARMAFGMATRHLNRLRQMLNNRRIHVEECELQVKATRTLCQNLQAIQQELLSEQQVVTDRMHNSGWLNALGSVASIYLGSVSSAERSKLWADLKQLVPKSPRGSSQGSLNESESCTDFIPDASILKAVQTADQLLSGPYELSAWMSRRTFPSELLLSPSEGSIAPVLEVTLFVRAYLESNQFLSKLVPLIFDPDRLIFKLLGALVNEDDAKMSKNSDSSRQVRGLIEIPISSSDFDHEFKLSLEKGNWIFVNLDDYTLASCEKNIKGLNEFWQMAASDEHIHRLARIAVITSRPMNDKRANRFYSLLSDMNLLPIDAGMSSIEVGGAIAECALRLTSSENQVLDQLLALRQEEASMLRAIQKLKLDRLGVLIELQRVVICSPNWTTSINSPEPTSVGQKDGPIYASSSTLIRYNAQLSKLTSELFAKEHQLHMCRKQRRHLERQFSTDAALLGVYGCIPNLIRQVTLLVALTDDQMTSALRWSCRRLRHIVMRRCYNAAVSFLRDKYGTDNSDESEKGDVDKDWKLRFLCRLAMGSLITWFSTIQTQWGHPAGTELRLKFGLCLSRLNHARLTRNQLRNPCDIPELQLLNRITKRMEGILPQSASWPAVDSPEVTPTIEYLEQMCCDLSGLSRSVRENQQLWEETILAPFHFLRPLPGFSSEANLCEEHVFLVWVALKPERFSEATQALITYVLDCFELDAMFDDSFHGEVKQKEERIREIYSPTPRASWYGTPEIHGGQWCETLNCFVQIHAILPPTVCENTALVFSRHQGRTPRGRQILGSKKRLLELATTHGFEVTVIDLSVLHYENHCSNNIDETVIYPGSILLLENAHILAEEGQSSKAFELIYNIQSYLGWLPCSSVKHHFNSVRQSYRPNEPKNGEVQRRFYVFLDFSCSTHMSELKDSMNSLPVIWRENLEPFLSLSRPPRDIQPSSGRDEPLPLSTLSKHQATTAVTSAQAAQKKLGSEEELLVCPWTHEHRFWSERIDSCHLIQQLVMSDRSNLTSDEMELKRNLINTLGQKFMALKMKYAEIKRALTATGLVSEASFIPLLYAQFHRLQLEVTQRLKNFDGPESADRLVIWLKQKIRWCDSLYRLFPAPGGELIITTIVSAHLVTDLWVVQKWLSSRDKQCGSFNQTLFGKVIKPGDGVPTGNGILLSSLYFVMDSSNISDVVDNPDAQNRVQQFSQTRQVEKCCRAYDIPTLWLTTIKPSTTSGENVMNQVLWSSCWPLEWDSIIGSIQMVFENAAEDPDVGFNYYLVPKEL
ncbi:unnamed protein product [Calicophoron daubneyi]|uniref:Cytoplasmic dynein 2 heavy chain 1 n=1 Tax=Calicophoron daubneyi TaxID=300641 RepID=A0AAV2T2D6_CALDB